MGKTLRSFALLFSSLLTLGACKTAPLQYAPENLYPQATKKNVVIYFFRPTTTESSSIRKNIAETTNGQDIPIGVLADGTYFVHTRPAGTATFQITDALSTNGFELTALFEAGKTYYISYYVKTLLRDVASVGMPEFTFDFVPPEQAEAQVQNLRMLEIPLHRF